MTDRDILFWLAISKVSCKKINALLSVYPPIVLWEQIKREEAFIKLVGDSCFKNLKHYHSESLIDRCQEALQDKDINFLALSDRDYPKRLAQKEVVPPPILFYRGDRSLLNTETVAIVGTRTCTKYGCETARKFATEFAESGITVVSGLATGIDGFAHKAVLDAGGKTIAVLGSGLNKMTPVSNYSLYKEICEKGIVITEYLPNDEPTKYTFPARNRIISGLSRAVLVVEAGIGSGSLITAEYAASQGRDVYAVPGNLTSINSMGANRLIKDSGAKLAVDCDDILQDLKLASNKKIKNCMSIQLDIFEEKLYNTLKSGEKSFDELVLMLEIPPSELSPIIFGLEMKKIIHQTKVNTYEIEI